MKVKFCGVTRIEDLKFCVAEDVDFIGFNFFGGSKRFLPVADAARLWRQVGSPGQRVAGSTRAVGVFVNPSQTQLQEVWGQFSELSVLQLHGEETPEQVVKLRSVLPESVSCWKAISVHTEDDIRRASEFAVDLVLFDGGSATERGGTGHAFDWRLLANCELPFGLAGGISIANLKGARELKPALIDICSGIEVEPGLKDHGMMRDILIELRPR